MEKETPKEKAKQLVETFKPNAYIGACEESDYLMELYHSKECAKKAVDLIVESMFSFFVMYPNWKQYKIKYWNEVKNEIENI